MADPLSVAAGVAGLLSLAYQLVEIGTKYSSSSPKAQGLDFIVELQALVDVLQRLKDFLQGPGAPSMFDHMSTLLSTRARCETKLREILRKLEKSMNESNRFKRAINQLMWPLAIQEHREAIEDIHRYTGIFDFALTIEGCALLAISTSETATALKEQARKIEETKSLCMNIPDLSVQIEASLARISRIHDLIEALPDNTPALATISQDISELKDAAIIQDYRYNEAERREILRWLSPITYEAKQRQLFERHQRGTGEWLTSHKLYKEWMSTRGSKLWCSGKPGAGKTSMASLVINTLRECHHPTIPTTFVYADFKERYEQNQHHLISAISRQLASQNAAFMDDVCSRYRKHKEYCQGGDVSPLTFAEHVELLQTASAYINRMFIIIDAVDEIPSTEEIQGTDVRFELLHALTRLEYVSLLCTSRLQIEASSYSVDFFTLAIEATDDDLRTFLDTKMSLSRRLVSLLQKEPPLREEIIQTITQKVSGIFLLARLQIEEVKTALSIRQVRSILEKLSSKYKDMYETTLDRVKSQTDVEAKLGLRAISWVANVVRPLTVSEFVHALSVEPGDDSLDSNSLIDISFILESCAGLLQLQPASIDSEVSRGSFQSEETVELVHYTLQEFLDASARTTAAHVDVANTSLSYLCFKDFRRKGLLYHTDSRRQYPFLAYAAPFWPVHAKAAGDALRKDLIEMLLSPSYPEIGKNWLGFALRRHFGDYSSRIPLGFAAAAVAIHGASDVLEFMLRLGLLVNVRFRTKFNPFGFALPVAPQECMELIFSGGLTSNVSMNRTWSVAALRLCHKYNHMDLFSALLKKHMDSLKTSDHADAKSIPGVAYSELPEASLLKEAVWLQETDLVKKLIHAGWTVNAAYIVPDHTSGECKHSTALHDAVRRDAVPIVRLLLAAGSNVKGPWPCGLRSPLSEARGLRRWSIARLLTDAGASIYEPLPTVPPYSNSAGLGTWKLEVDSPWSQILEQQKALEARGSEIILGKEKRSHSWIL